MFTIHIRIGHNNNFIIAKLGNVKVIAIAFGKTTAKGINHGLDFCISKNFIDAGFFYVQNLTANRQNRLIHTISGTLCTSTRRITFHDKDFAFRSIFGLTVSKLSVRVKGKFLLG